jgi:hypothetical protein
MQFKWINKIVVTSLITVAVLVQSALAKETVSNGYSSSSAARSAVSTSGSFDGNRVRDDLENNGMIVSHRISGHSGMEWPKDNYTYSVFASGVW